MSRYSETVDIIKKTTNQLIGICEYNNDVSEKEMLSGIYTILTDIALSLAVIADKEAKND